MLNKQLRRQCKFGIKVIVAFVVLSLMVLAGLVIATHKKYLKQVDHAQVKNSVSIERNEYGIPNIHAQNNEDALFALGYVHAQARYWQMMITRETAKGRLAAIAGSTQLDHDRIMRRLDLKTVAQKTYQNQSQETKRYLTAYARGINLWVNTHKNDWLPKTVEQLFTQTTFEPWQPEDAILIQKYMGFNLSNKIEQSLVTMWFYQNLTEMQRNALLPNMKIPEKIWPTIMHFSQDDSLFAHAGASNVFSVDAKQTKNGATLFAADPHLELFAPSMWFIASLAWDGHQVTGATIPGIPLVLNGRNPYLAWGQTITGLDDQDVSLIGPNEKNKANLISEKPIQIAIKGAKAFDDHIQITRHGPIFDPGLFGYGFNPKYELVLQWTGFNEHDESYPFAWGIMSAKSIQEALKKPGQLVAPAQNFLVADKSTSQLTMVGQIPRRSALQPSQGRSPGFFHDEREHWQGVMDANENPTFKPGIKGYLINTNNAITTKPFPNNITFNWIDDYRIKRAEHMIRVNHEQTYADIKHTQLDTTSEKALWVTSLLLTHLKKDKIKTIHQPIVNALKSWQGEMAPDHFEPLVYNMWLNYFLKDMLSSLGEQWVYAERLNPRFAEQLLKSPQHYPGWCASDCNEEVTTALEKTLNRLTFLYGHDHEAWRWGRYHHAFHMNPVLNQIPILRWFANIDHPSGGDRETLAMMEALPFEKQAYRGSGLRTIVDFSDPGQMIHIILATGQSGQITSPHYVDQNQLWRYGKYVDYDPKQAKVQHKTVLMP